MTDSTANAPQATTPNLGIQDLVIVAQIIQIATKRGVWETEELSTVGTLYDRLMAFLDAAGALNRPEQTDATAPSETAPAETKEKKNVKARSKA